MKQYSKILYHLFFISILFVGCGTNNIESTTKLKISDEIDCDINIDKKYFNICYNYKLKGALYVSYTLDGSLVDSQNITQRPVFHRENSIPKEYQSDASDYIGSGYDKGHLANDASFDYSLDSLNNTYSMANIIPQNPDVNRYSWIDTEYLERKKAKQYSKVDVIIEVIYNDNPKQIGKNEISVPTGFYKKILNKKYNYEECFYYENIPYDIAEDSIENHKVNCSLVKQDSTL